MLQHPPSTPATDHGTSAAEPADGQPGAQALIPLPAFRRIRELVQSRFGLKLEDNKRWMVSCRLQRLVREHGFGSVTAFCDRLVGGDDNPEVVSALVAHLTTNHTYFYRHPEQFEALRATILPELTTAMKRAGTTDLRVWCAAAATGEEPYVLAMAIREHLVGSMAGWRGGLIATDISPRALEVAKRGEYTQDSIKNLPPEWRSKYIESHHASIVVSDVIRRDVLYRRLNLMDALPFREPMHLIFCRNVLYYFDIATRGEVLARMLDKLRPGGYVVLAPSERPNGFEAKLKQMGPGIFKRIGA